MVRSPLHFLRHQAWKSVKRMIHNKFPNAPAISTTSLAAWLQSGTQPAPILLDVRRPEEFAVSHLPHAYYTPNLDSVRAMDLSLDTPLVVYCSVGYRSARLVEQLRAAGFTQAVNLEGSIFQWANEGRAIVQAGQPAKFVHPYNWLWGLLLNGDIRGRSS
ncbi:MULTISPECIES: rhodanese-like domain-containing protein [unclassified Leptolyngbya]|uniref:rhodanese-like domain-containing protein n=1 Tax=unclassified Leptolyngbya TaxID=2650499 RepID=UPI001686091D|nr:MULTISPECIES: rhodanese-like domain-containing protein [unclassified Leptolyngbya]MBD1913514.1 rhodanese-like domain-containing protein [Leptolyngbya sp. FACHB-8]MBD2153264.1 rhodanese-like domain-containing protein [Leptolyngbya sp. FACHB-16]